MEAMERWGWHSRRPGLSEEQLERCKRYVSAAEVGDVDEVLRLLETGMPVNSGTSGICGHYPVIIDACKRGDIAMVSLLLQHGAIPKHDESAGEDANPIFSCALQKRFPDTPMCDGSHRTAVQNEAILSLLVNFHYLDVWRQLQRREAYASDLDGREWWSRGEMGAGFDDDDLLALLRDVAGHLLVDSDEYALHDACERGDIAAARALIARGADVSLRNELRDRSRARVAGEGL